MEAMKRLQNVLCMKGGNGDSSYAYNSSVPLNVIMAMKPVLEHSIYKNASSIMEMREVDKVFRIADLGCATGINTLLTVDTIVNAVKLTFIQHSMEVPEFQVYFADLPSNDFNTLFRTLPPLKSGADGITAAAHNEDKPPATRCYFASAVSGSHHGRLFPRQTLHFCHSSISLHWLSQVPSSVENRNSVAWNDGHIYISSDAVADAYLNQFRQDFASFLEARAQEIAPGGCMFAALPARNSGYIKQQGGLGAYAGHLEAAFEELVNQGLIDKEKLDSFNLPFYGPSVEELQSIVEAEQSFEIENMRLLAGFPSYPLSEVREGEEEKFGRIVGNFYRAVFENIVGSHLGSDFYRAVFENIVGSHLGSDEHLVDEIFLRIAKRAAAKYEEFVPDKLDVAVAILIRKGN